MKRCVVNMSNKTITMPTEEYVGATILWGSFLVTRFKSDRVRGRARLITPDLSSHWHHNPYLVTPRKAR